MLHNVFHFDTTTESPEVMTGTSAPTLSETPVIDMKDTPATHTFAVNTNSLTTTGADAYVKIVWP